MKFKEMPLNLKDQESDSKRSTVVVEDQVESEKPLSRQEIVEREYEEVFKLRAEQYQKDIDEDHQREIMLPGLEMHNEVVLGYANELIEAKKDLTPEEKVAATLATIMHDGGKLSSGLLEHHQRGVEYTDKIINEMLGQEIEGVETTEKLKEKVKEAIERHMNHPFLVMLRKGERFPEPEDDVDKIVFDADMMANVGFKNVGFRVINENFINRDREAATKKGVTVLEETFKNVMQGVKQLREVVLTQEAKEKTGDLVEAAEAIDKYFKDKNIFQTIQDQFSVDGEYTFDTIKKMGGPQLIKKLLNEEIIKAGSELNIDKKIIDNFQL